MQADNFIKVRLAWLRSKSLWSLTYTFKDNHAESSQIWIKLTPSKRLKIIALDVTSILTIANRGRLSGPLLDRIDLALDVPPLSPEELAAAPTGESSAPVRARVSQARRRQEARQGGLNAHLEGAALEQHCRPDKEAQALLGRAVEQMQLSPRAYHRILRVGRTIADLAGRDSLGPAAVAEAIQYRRFDRAR